MSQVAQFPELSSRAVIGFIFQSIDEMMSQSWVPRLANRFVSDQSSETYAGVGVAPQMRQWIGEKNIKELGRYTLRIDNKDWESTLRIFRKDLRRDKTDQLRMKAGQLAERAVMHDAKLISTLINTGDANTNGLAFDGKTFFADDHVIGESGTIDNKIVFDISDAGTGGTPTAPTAATAAAAMLKAIQTLYGFKDDQGEPTNQSVGNFLVMVPTALWGVFLAAARKEFLSATVGSTNPLIGTGLNIEVIQNPRLTWTDKFAVFAQGLGQLAFISQIEDGPRVETLADGSDYDFFNAAHLFSVIKSGNVGYGDFTKAVQVTLQA